MELVLLRHAQPEWDRDDVAQVDPRLTELGRRQARLTATRLADDRFDEILVSTARRAQETAAPVVEVLDGVPRVDRAWMHEIHSPAHWQDSPAAEVSRVMRDARHRSREEWWEGLPGGESFRDFHARVTIGLTNELAELGIERDPDTGLWEVPDRSRRVLLVAHAGTNSVVLGHLLGLPPEPWEWERFASDHASLTTVRAVPIAGRCIFSLQQFSDVAHLPPQDVTG